MFHVRADTGDEAVYRLARAFGTNAVRNRQPRRF